MTRMSRRLTEKPTLRLPLLRSGRDPAPAFDQLSERNETRSTLLTTNLSFGEWVQVFGDEKRTIALLDRLGRHAHVLTTRGESYRTRKRRRKEEPKVAP